MNDGQQRFASANLGGGRFGRKVNDGLILRRKISAGWIFDDPIGERVVYIPQPGGIGTDNHSQILGTIAVEVTGDEGADLLVGEIVAEDPLQRPAYISRCRRGNGPGRLRWRNFGCGCRRLDRSLHAALSALVRSAGREAQKCAADADPKYLSH